MPFNPLHLTNPKFKFKDKNKELSRTDLTESLPPAKKKCQKCGKKLSKETKMKTHNIYNI